MKKSHIFFALIAFFAINTTTLAQNFYLHTNGVTCMCPDAQVGDTGDVNGITYTKRIKADITPANAATTCTSGITDMSGLFQNNQSFNGNISTWDTSSVTDMNSMFSGASNFNSDISNWNVSSVTNMFAMFHYSNFNKPIGNWNVISVTNMSGMFQNSPFNKPIDNWNVSSVTNMNSMFYNSAFNQPINNWNVSNVTNMEGMFRNSPFNQPLSNWNVSNVVNMSFMFEYSNFNKPIENWNVINVTNMKWMFDTNTAFNQPLNSWNVSNVTNMERMFYNSQAFNQSLSSWNVSNVTNMGGMFWQSGFNQNIGDWQFSTDVILTISNSGFVQDSQMNIQNYDALLSKFDSLGLLDNILRSNNLKYSNQTVRNNLINNKGWTITGDAYSAPPVPPTLSNSYVAPRKIKIDFTPSSSNNVTGYNVYKSTDNTAFTLATTLTTNSYTETGLQNGTTYYYKIGAVNNLNQESTTFLEVSATPSNTWYVSTTGSADGFGSSNQPMSAIQTAINASVSGEIVQVGNGTYIENIMYNGKNITVTSLFSTSQNEADITNTIIDGGGGVGFPVVRFHNGETNNAKLIGFTIQNGYTATNEWSAGIDTNTASPELKNLIIKNNNCANSWPKTGGIRVVNANAPVLIENTTIKDNTGGAIYSLTGITASLKIKNCKIFNNTTTTAASAVYFHGDQDSNLPIENTLIFNNASNDGGNVVQGSNVVLLNSTIYNNNSGLYLGGNSGIINSIIGSNQTIINQGILKIYNSLVQDGQNSIINPIAAFLTYSNSISGNPLFVNPQQNDFHLTNYSPAIGVGIASISLYSNTYNAPTTDIESASRPNPTGSNPDIGAYENSYATTQHNSIIYVATNGNNTGSVGLETAPFATIQAAINYAINGDQVLVKPGVYSGSISLNKSITIKSTNGYQQTTLKNINNNENILTIFGTFDNMNPISTNISGFKFISDVTNNIDIKAIRIETAAFSKIQNCWFENLSYSVSTYYGYYDMINCLYYNLGAVSVHDAGYSSDDRISRLIHATIINVGSVTNAGSQIYSKIYNSIITRNNGQTVTPYFNGAVPLLNKVLIDANPNTQPGSVFTTISSIDDIYFNNVSNIDYTLKNYSPAIGYGGALSNVVDDIDGNPRPTLSFPDLGAYENSLNTRSNAPPRINQVANIVINEDAAQQTINLSGIADGDLFASQTLTLSHTNSNAALFSNFTINHSASAATGTLVFTPAPNAFGTANITITVLDSGNENNGGINSKTISFTITLNPINDAPVAIDDSISVNEGATVSILTNSASSVSNNDTDVDNTSLTSLLVNNPTHGSVTLNSDGTFTYVHDGSETTSDSFTYKINDGLLDSNNATVSISITPVNDTPIAVNNSITVNEGATISILSNNQTSVLQNDTDAENNALTAVLVSGPTHGTLTLNADGTFNYIHDGSETTSDSFTYKANDGQLDGNTASVSIIINPVNDNGPTDMTLSSITLNENVSAISIGQFSTTDIDLPADTHAYELVSGAGDTNNSNFAIVGATLSNTVAFDYENQQSASIRVKVTDANANSFEKVFTITILNVNDINITFDKTDSYCSGNAGNGTITINTVNQTVGALTYNWTASNGGAIPSGQVNNQNLNSLSAGTYSVSISDTFFTYTQSFNIVLIPQYNNLSICYVSSDDTQVTKNRIYLNNQGNYNVAFYEILKESSISNVYTTIGTALPNQNSFLDDFSNNMAQEYRYKVRLIDNCGNTSSNSAMHKTILLQSSISVNNSVNLSWTSYTGADIPSYIIYRKINQGVFQQIATISSSSNTYNDQTANVIQNGYEYYVAVGVASCNTAAGRNASTITEIKSNRQSLGTLASTNFNLSSQVSVYPNPTNNLLNIKLNDGNDFISGEIFNSLGQKVMDVNEVQISVEPLPTSTYFVKIITSQGQATKSFIKN